MNDSSDPAARNDPSRNDASRNDPSSRPARAPHQPDEWRLWRPFFLGLGGLVLVLVAISVSL